MIATAKPIGNFKRFERIESKSQREWLEARHPFIGASEAAAVVNQSSWQSPYGLWGRKRSPIEDYEPTIEQQVGHELEPLIARTFTQATGIGVIDPGSYTLFTSNSFPWLACTPDRMTADGVPVELKTAKFEAAKEWKTKVPIAYQIQITVQMMVMGSTKGYIAVLLNTSSFKWHEVALNEALAERLLAWTESFHRHCIIGGNAPKVDGSEPTRKALGRVYPVTEEGLIELEGVDSLGDRYDKLCKVESSAKKHKTEIQNRVKEAIGSAQLGRLADGSGFRWSGAEGKRRFTRVKEVRE